MADGIYNQGGLGSYFAGIPAGAAYLMRSLSNFPKTMFAEPGQNLNPYDPADAAAGISALGLTPLQALMNKSIDPRARLALMMQNQISPQMVMGDRLFRRGRNTAQPGTTQSEYASVAP